VQEYPSVSPHSNVGSGAHVLAIVGSRTPQQKSVEPIDSLPGPQRRRLSVSQGLAVPLHEKAYSGQPVTVVLCVQEGETYAPQQYVVALPRALPGSQTTVLACAGVSTPLQE
jgi:hypothetical protein